MPSEASATAPTVTAADLRVMGMRVRVSSAAWWPRPFVATRLRRQDRAAGSLRVRPVRGGRVGAPAAALGGWDHADVCRRARSGTAAYVGGRLSDRGTSRFLPSGRPPPGREPPGQLRAEADPGAEGDGADDDGDEPVPLLL